MASKHLELKTVDGEHRWCLDGKPLGREVLVITRGGMEVHGVFQCEGDEPPGVPTFTARFDTGHETVMQVKTESDTFRRQTTEESSSWRRPLKPTLS
jgi:hypothetical protein